MQDKTEIDSTEVETITTESTAEFSHCYYETGNDILSKPRALVDLLEQLGTPATVIFCNAPSEADLVAAMLRKSGLNCQKLIGHVPASKVEQTNEELQAETLKIVVTTDIGATDLKMECFEYLLNYSIHEDPETYLNRCVNFKAGAKIKKIISLVSPLDVGNFHYLKKLVEFDFEKAELPSKAELAEAKLSKLFHQAEISSHLSEEGMSEIAEKILAHGSSKAIIALLLHNTLVALPEAISQARPRGSQSQDREGGDDKYSRPQRRDNRRSNDRDRNDDRGDRGDRGDRRQYEENQKSETRYYLGAGSQDGGTVEQIKSYLTEQGIEDSVVKRVFLRDNYGFVDVETEHAEKVLDVLKNLEISGKKACALKATEIPGLKSERNGGSRQPHGGRKYDRQESSSEATGNQEGEAQEEETFEDDLSQVQMLANYDKSNKGRRKD